MPSKKQSQSSRRRRRRRRRQRASQGSTPTVPAPLPPTAEDTCCGICGESALVTRGEVFENCDKCRFPMCAPCLLKITGYICMNKHDDETSIRVCYACPQCRQRWIYGFVDDQMFKHVLAQGAPVTHATVLSCGCGNNTCESRQDVAVIHRPAPCGKYECHHSTILRMVVPKA